MVDSIGGRRFASPRKCDLTLREAEARRVTQNQQSSLWERLEATMRSRVKTRLGWSALTGLLILLSTASVSAVDAFAANTPSASKSVSKSVEWKVEKSLQSAIGDLGGIVCESKTDCWTVGESAGDTGVVLATTGIANGPSLRGVLPHD